MKRYLNFSLKNHNTFKINVIAREFIEVDSSEDLIELANEGIFKGLFFTLGEGSNVLLTKDFDGAILKINIKGIEKIEDSEESVVFRVGAGEVWDNLVAETINLGGFGLENLSLIPSSVGASTVQNIGAYGAESKDFIESVEYFDLIENSFKTLKNSEIEFKYRDSIFKNKLKGRSIITSVKFKLSKSFQPNLNYDDIKKYIEVNNIRVEELTPQKVRDIIIYIRTSKLEDHNIVGNAGSFFKNPVVETSIAEKIRSEYSDFKYFELPDGFAKLSAAWLIEKAGWKGWTSKNGNYGVSSKHSLVLVNYCNSTGQEIFNLAQQIKEDILNKFNISLEEEVINI